MKLLEALSIYAGGLAMGYNIGKDTFLFFVLGLVCLFIAVYIHRTEAKK